MATSADDALVLRISATTDEFVKKIEDAKTKVKSLSTQMAEIDKQLKTENVDKVGKLSEKLELAKRASQMAAKEVDLYGEKIAALTAKHKSAEEMTEKEQQTLAKLAEKMAEAKQRANTFALQVDQVEKELNEAQTAGEGAAESFEDVGDSAEDAGKKSLSLGDIIKANVISSVITKGLQLVGNLFKNIASSALSAVKSVAGFVSETIELSSNMEETRSKVAAVYGEDGQKEMEKWAENAAHDFHTTKQAAMEAASAYGNILVNMGMAAKEAQKYSQDLILVAAAQADFNNMETGEVLEKIQSALAGNYKGLQSLGIVLKETDIQERALINTHKENADQLTDLEKKQAAIEIITEKSAFAVQKYEENSGSLVSMQSELKAKLIDVKTEIGDRLRPVAEEFFNKIINFTNTEQFSDLLDTIYDSFDEIATSVLNFINSGRLDGYIQWLTENLPTLGNKIAEVAGKVADIVEHVWNFVDALAELYDRLTNTERARQGHEEYLRQNYGWVGSLPTIAGNTTNTSNVVNNNNSQTYGDTNIYVTSNGTNAAAIADEISAAVNQKLRLSGSTP